MIKEMTGYFGASQINDQMPELPKPKASMGKEDFMKLLLAQLQHQDPLKPMDHEQFASQLAQFGQLEQLTNIGTGIKDLKTGFGEDSKLKALGLIGKKVSSSGNEVEMTKGKETVLRPTQKEGLTPFKAAVTNSAGKIVREIDLTLQKPNERGEITWDGKNTEGEPLPSGRYSFRTFGMANDGKTQELVAETLGKVIGVDLDGAAPTLMIQTSAGTQRMDLAKVKHVSLDEGTPVASAGKTPDAAKSAAATPAEKTDGKTDSKVEAKPDAKADAKAEAMAALRELATKAAKETKVAKADDDDEAVEATEAEAAAEETEAKNETEDPTYPRHISIEEMHR